MNHKELARQIAQFFTEHPDAWGRKFLAVDELGMRTSPDSPVAAQWCVMGIASKLDRTEYYFSARPDLYYHISVLAGVSAPEWNDARKDVSEVISLMERIACE